MEKNLNKKILSFLHDGRSYEVDKLLDASDKERDIFDIYDVTNDRKGKCVGQIVVSPNSQIQDLKEEAIIEIET